MNEDVRGFSISSRSILGLCIVVFGLMLTANNLGWSPDFDVFAYAPLLLSVVGVARLSHDASRRSWLAAVLIIVGIWWTVDNVVGIRFHIWQWWPVLLIVFGVKMVLRSREHGISSASSSSGSATEPSPFSPFSCGTAANADSTASADSETITALAFWSGCRRRTASQRFRRADVTAVMGGVDIDLRQASTATGEAVLDVFAMWGGVRVRVPPDWAIVNEVLPIMGASDDRTTGGTLARHRLRVRGVVIMGGIDIRS